MFFIGTTAELIKVFPIIIKLRELNVPFRVIASGQNNIADTDIVRALKILIDLQLSNEDDIIKNAVGLFSWYNKTLRDGKNNIINHFSDMDFKNSIMVVHGDTISTLMGAKLGKRLGMRVAHIEAGLRSGNLFLPFPEEIDRIMIGKMADFNFCPGNKPSINLSAANGEIINTKLNTVIDALSISDKMHCSDDNINSITNDDYFVSVLHRQENLINISLVEKYVEQIITMSNSKKAVMILHKITENTLISFHLLEKLEQCENVVLLRRAEYFDFMKLLRNAKFVITDGGSNQEELCYMGKPCLIVRKQTEREDGLGYNAILYNGNINYMTDFLNSYKNYIRPAIIPDKSPSLIIAEKLMDEVK